jgi:hypothetical protein
MMSLHGGQSWSKWHDKEQTHPSLQTKAAHTVNFFPTVICSRLANQTTTAKTPISVAPSTMATTSHLFYENYQHPVLFNREDG